MLECKFPKWGKVKITQIYWDEQRKVWIICFIHHKQEAGFGSCQTWEQVVEFIDKFKVEENMK